MLQTLLTKAPTKNLERALIQRDMDGMRLALELGANVHALSVLLPGDTDPIEHPFEIALMNFLPLEGFLLLAQAGARASNMEGGADAIESFFEGVTSDVEKVWPDARQIKQFLLSPEMSEDVTQAPKSEIVEGAIRTAQNAATGLKEGAKAPFQIIGQGMSKAADLGKKTTSGIFGKFKK